MKNRDLGHMAIVSFPKCNGFVRQIIPEYLRQIIPQTTAIPIWVKQGINAWMTAAQIEEGRLLRSVSKSGTINRDTLSDWAVWSIVEQSSKQIGIEHFGAHDLRRTCANVWSAALSQAKSEVTGWSAQMYSTFGGVYDSWPGWNALRPLPI
jgi:integrase